MDIDIGKKRLAIQMTLEKDRLRIIDSTKRKVKL